MPLQPGEHLGPYQIVSLLGKGGMGEVYRARDTRLDREVAIKISSEQFTDRFSREAHAVAALNHPNVCTLHDVGPNYLVMELVEGATLAERIKSGAIPLEESLAIARQIAAALEAAHEKGITHRDLKPGNIKVKPDGTVKVLDFGLAKVVAPASAGVPEDSPTLSMQATQAGVILGTAAYMAPEQARGKTVDKRADIWAFGVVLYEMVTGKRLFQGEDLTDTLAAVVRDKTDLTAAPPQLQRLLDACLQKEPKQRLRDIADVWKLLDPEPGPAAARVAAASSRPWLWPAIAAVCTILAAVATWALWRTEPVRSLVRLEADLGPEVALTPPGAVAIALSPDGTRIAYTARTADGPPRLFTRRLDQPRAIALPGTEGAQSVFFSPDSQWIGFNVVARLNKISVEGGAVVPIGDAGIYVGASWSEDGSILVGGALSRGLTRFPAAGGTPTKILDLASGELAHTFPQVLPGSKAAVFTTFGATPDVDRATIDAVTFADGARKTIVRGGNSPHYLPSGHLIYVNKGTLFAVSFDPETLETRGAAVPILDDVLVDPQFSSADLSFSRNGTFLYRAGAGGATTLSTVQWIDATGKRSPLLAKPGTYELPKLSPDGKLLALRVTEGGIPDVQVYDPQRDTMNKLTFGGGANIDPKWSPDGRYVVFGGAGIFWTRADGAGQPQPLTEAKSIQIPWSFTPNGDRLAYFEFGAGSGGGSQIFTVPIERDGEQWKAGTAERFLKSAFNEFTPEFSPDGRWLAYATNESGTEQVNVRPFPPPASGQGGKWQISNNGGYQPRWSRTAPELLYQSGNQILAVPYRVDGDTFTAERPRVRIENLGGREWDLASDGRIAVIVPEQAAQPQAAPARDHTVVFLENFFDELRRRVPVE